jgi:cysteinyl-tRNA synthetase
LIKEGKEELTGEDLESMKKTMHAFSNDVLGLYGKEETTGSDITPELVEMLLNIRIQAKKNKDFATADKIRDDISRLGIVIKDTKDGFEWKYQ